MKYVSKKQFARWFVMLLVGIVTGLVAVVIDFLVENILGRSNVAAPFEQHNVNKIFQVK